MKNIIQKKDEMINHLNGSPLLVGTFQGELYFENAQEAVDRYLKSDGFYICKDIGDEVSIKALMYYKEGVNNIDGYLLYELKSELIELLEIEDYLEFRFMAINVLPLQLLQFCNFYMYSPGIAGPREREIIDCFNSAIKAAFNSYSEHLTYVVDELIETLYRHCTVDFDEKLDRPIMKVNNYN